MLVLYLLRFYAFYRFYPSLHVALLFIILFPWRCPKPALVTLVTLALSGPKGPAIRKRFPGIDFILLFLPFYAFLRFCLLAFLSRIP